MLQLALQFVNLSLLCLNLFLLRLIGRLDTETGKLIPNRNYYEIYQKKPMPVHNGVCDHGVGDVFEKVSKKLGITKLIHQYFPENAEEILTSAQYMLSEGNVMLYVDEYSQTHTTALAEGISNEMQQNVFFPSSGRYAAVLPGIGGAISKFLSWLAFAN